MYNFIWQKQLKSNIKNLYNLKSFGYEYHESLDFFNRS